MRGQGWLFLVVACSLGLAPLPGLNLLRSIIRRVSPELFLLIDATSNVGFLGSWDWSWIV
jgi:hypothetical protein